MKKNTNEFRPVILGIDVGSYSVARTFYEHYRVKSFIVGKATYWMTSYSKITEPLIVDDMTEEKLIDFLIDLSKKNSNIKLILFGCSEDYVDMIIRHKEKLLKYFIVPTIDESTLHKVVIKENFYKECEKLGINYPKTLILNKSNYKNVEIPFSYPIVGKASDFAKYSRIDFANKKKIYLIKSYEELMAILNNCYSSSYNDDFIVQEYIAGDDTYLRVLTCYCDENSDVIFSSVGHVLLGEKGPSVTGNYACIVNTTDDTLVEDAKKFLKDTKYVGFANFDIKYDSNTNKHYFFELNVRLGRSNFYMGSNHTNYLEPLVDTYIYKIKGKKYTQKGPEMYRIVPNYVINKYIKNKDILKKYKSLKRNNPLVYEEDMNFKRSIYVKLALLNHIKKYKKYYED